MIYIIGLGIQGKSSLSQRALNIIKNANLLVGGKRHLACFHEFKGKRIVIGSDLNKVIKVLTPHSSLLTPNYAVVLATGDPNFFGIADFLIRNLGKNKVEIIPNVSAMQEAFARIKENWNDARFLSVHGKYRGQGVKGSRGQEKNAFDTIVDKIVNYNKVGIFTDPENTPSKIARALLDKGIKDYTAYVCEDLGTEKEKITQGTLSQIAKKKFSPLNVMILIRGQGFNPRTLEPSNPAFFGIPDSEFSHSKGMLTKQEIRVIALSKLKIKDNSIVWDIGAGSGSLSIEAALFARNGMVFAVEKEKKRITHIEKNKRKFLAANLEIIKKNAPAGLKSLPSPDAVFIGGGGKDIDKILDICAKKIKPKGRIVVNAVTIETLSTAAEFFKKAGWTMEIISVNIAKTKHVPVGFKQGDAANLNLFNACNPVFIIVGEKP
ncbi:MAG: precorrin-6y C5,15-methyltransferase (decarboxylating) subunit CbiE [Deltaproteobacteria bacterium]|nr:precorrin-6y C5,15-methyltransferase (decarboxylating) subunit CbiE [Deltaproteobacteria bacterium]